MFTEVLQLDYACLTNKCAMFVLFYTIVSEIISV